ncbi:MAG: immunoglobulin domain-containing protein, partial [Opitutaceae bacterium]
MRIVTLGLVLTLIGLVRLGAVDGLEGTGGAVVEVEPGRTLTFSASAQSESVLRFQWRKNGADIPGAIGERLTLENVTDEDGGIYSALAANEMGVS